MSCREVREAIRGFRGLGLGEKARRHLAACPRCAAEARAAALLRIGSDRSDEAAPRPGFETRLMARLASEASTATAPAAGRAPGAAGARATPLRIDALDRLVRPALVVSAALALLAAGLYVRSAPPAGETELASLVEGDEVFGSLLAGHAGALFASPDDRADATEEGAR